jgi:hypothetical protein
MEYKLLFLKEIVSSMASPASRVEPSPARVGGFWMSMALTFLMAIVSSKASPTREARAGGLWSYMARANLNLKKLNLTNLIIKGFFHEGKSPLGLPNQKESREPKSCFVVLVNCVSALGNNCCNPTVIYLFVMSVIIA